MRTHDQLKNICYGWFNAISRKNWDNWSLKAAGEELANVDPESELLHYSANELYKTMAEIIQEYDELKK